MGVVIYPNDHRPAHVHVIGGGCEAVFNLNEPPGHAELRENYGFSRREIGQIESMLTDQLNRLFGEWERFMKSTDDIEQANRRGGELQEHSPRAVSVRYDPKAGRIVIHLSSRLIVSFAPEDAQGLENARPSQLREIEISPSGFGLHFPAMDADLYVPGLLEGFLGSKSWMASRLGQIGGQATSKAKKAASRANGRLGGRPKKVLQR